MNNSRFFFRLWESKLCLGMESLCLSLRVYRGAEMIFFRHLPLSWSTGTGAIRAITGIVCGECL
jgi:hypothetical protein